MAIGGWAVLTMLALPAVSGAWAADGSGQWAKEGPSRPHAHAHGPHANAGGPRGEGHPALVPADGDGDAPTQAPLTEPASPPAPAPEPAAPQIEIGTALGPQSGVGAPATATGTAAAVVAGERRVPLLSFDGPSPFAPRVLAGGLRDAPGARAVQVAIRRGGPRHGCGWWTVRGAHFTAARRDRCAAPRWMPAGLRRVAGGWRWRAALGGSLAPGSYRFLVRVLDAGGRPLAFEQA